MPIENSQSRKLGLAEGWLNAAVSHLEDEKCRRGAFNIMAARHADEVARLLGFGSPAARLERLLCDVTVADLVAGAVTSIKTTPEMSKQSVAQSALEEIERRYPPFEDSYVTEFLSQGEDHLHACMDRDYARASAAAKSELEEVEVALAQMVLGDFGAARSSLHRFRERHDNLLLVLAIELYRRDLFDEAGIIQARLVSEDAIWAPVHLALGVAQRVPWPGYPFPDY